MVSGSRGDDGMTDIRDDDTGVGIEGYVGVVSRADRGVTGGEAANFLVSPICSGKLGDFFMTDEFRSPPSANCRRFESDKSVAEVSGFPCSRADALRESAHRFNISFIWAYSSSLLS
jgi:hypothetical protein